VRLFQKGRTANCQTWASLLLVDNPSLHVTCVKQAEDGSGMIVRLFNPLASDQPLTVTLARPITQAVLCRADETEVEKLQTTGNVLRCTVGPKKIRTLKFIM